MLKSPGKLYVVATPIGNLKDFSHRAIETLKAVDLIACEDTRHTKILLTEYGIDRPLTSFFDGNEAAKAKYLSERIENGETIALVSDAGTPNICDPGFKFVDACIRKGIEVVSVPGASAIIAALSISGLPTHAFIFEGFMPPKSAARRKKMATWKAEERTVVFYESPYRVLKTLADLRATLGNIRIVIAREITKKFEEVRRDTVETLIAHFEKNEPRGEFVFLLNLGYGQEIPKE